MLKELHIRNYALIESIDIGFDKGFTAITGETGAGKSILMGALALLLGARADSSVLFDKSRKCVVEARFDIAGLALERFFEENDLDYDDETTVRREIADNGKSRAFINDTPVNLIVLRGLSGRLVDIHSQHQNLLLNDSDFRLKILDEYAGNQQLVKEYTQAFATYKTVEARCEQLAAEVRKNEEERDFLQFSLSELESAQLRPNEQTELEEEIAFLSNAQKIKENLFSAKRRLADEERNVLDALQEIRNLCQEISAYDKNIGEFANRLENTRIELKDLAADIERKEEMAEIDPERLNTAQERLSFLYSLEDKYHVRSLEELLQKQEDVAARLAQVSVSRDAWEQAEKEKQQHYEQVRSLAAELSGKRKNVTRHLQDDLLDKLALLGMPDSRFEIVVEALPQPAASGSDRVEFMFSANKGAERSEISKVASGGEISRVMLAVKSAVTTRALMPTIIFDEIDTGISGEVAGKTARVMEDIAAQRQLLVITHLPQIAAKARLHYFVYKSVEDERAKTRIRELSAAERETEIAKMISGEQISDAARQTAAELLKK